MTMQEILAARKAAISTVEADLNLEEMALLENYELEGINKLTVLKVEKLTNGGLNQQKYNRILHVCEHDKPETEYVIRMTLVGDGSMLARQYKDICEQVSDTKWSMETIDALEGKDICVYVTTNSRGYISYNFNSATITRLYTAATQQD